MLFQGQLQNTNDSSKQNAERSDSQKARKLFMPVSNQMSKENNNYRATHTSAELLDNKNEMTQQSQKNDNNNSERQKIALRSVHRNKES